MVDRPFALHHFYSRVVAGLQGQPYPIANKQLLRALSDQRPRPSAEEEEEEECDRVLMQRVGGGKPETSAFTGLCATCWVWPTTTCRRRNGSH
jgi:hypothetical protein